MKKFIYVEDYIEVINGDRDPNTGKLHGLFEGTPPIINLARYDVSVLSSMSQSVSEGRGLTDKQAELAVKLILKYRRQLEKIDIDVSTVENPQFRLSLRKIDRRQELVIEDEKIVLRFPYDTKMIDDIRDLSKISNGSWKFDSSSKSWEIALTESNVVAAHGFAKNNNFKISPEFTNFLNLVLSAEQSPHDICLVDSGSSLSITNAPSPLIDYITNSYCGFHPSNLEVLVDNAPVFGYTIDSNIRDTMIKKYSEGVYTLMNSREAKFSPTIEQVNIEDIIKYAEVTKRYPIYVYEPDMSKKLYNAMVQPYFNESDVYISRELKKCEPSVFTKVIYFNKFHISWEQPIPLLISGQGMMYGGEKSMLLQNAEKVVYFTTEVYNGTNLKRK